MPWLVASSHGLEQPLGKTNVYIISVGKDSRRSPKALEGEGNSSREPWYGTARRCLFLPTCGWAIAHP